MLDKKVKVKEIRDLGSRNFLLTLRSAEQARLIRPGHFIMVKCSGEIDENPLLRRPFSVFNVRPGPRGVKAADLDLLVKDVGAGTHRLAALQRGDEIYALGPQGRPFEVAPGQRDRGSFACLVAGGVGIAALYLLARELRSRDLEPILFYGGRTAADLVLRDHFEELGIETRYTSEDGSLGDRGLVTHALERFLKTRTRPVFRVYCCGPWGMMQATHEITQRHRLSCEVSLEARMGCSLGACMGCVIHAWDDQGEDQYLRVCLEGPVMNSRNVDWTTSPF